MKGESYKDPETLRRLYWVEGLSLRDIAEQFGVSPPTIQNSMEKKGVERERPDNDRPPHFDPAQKGKGYERIQTSVDGELATVRIHRLVAVAEHGFDAVAGKDVHHENGIPWDNRPSNLEPIDHAEHTKLHNQKRSSV